MIRIIIGKILLKPSRTKTQSEFGNPVLQQTACQGLRTGKLGKYYMSYGVNRSSLLKWLLLQNFMNIDGTMLISFFSSPPFSAGPQKYKHKIGHN